MQNKLQRIFEEWVRRSSTEAGTDQQRLTNSTLGEITGNFKDLYLKTLLSYLLTNVYSNQTFQYYMYNTLNFVSGTQCNISPKKRIE